MDENVRRLENSTTNSANASWLVIESNKFDGGKGRTSKYPDW
jgi:hypothetical protein